MEDSQSTDSEAGREGRALCRGRHSLERSYSSLCKQEPFKENKTSFPFLAGGGGAPRGADQGPEGIVWLPL